MIIREGKLPTGKGMFIWILSRCAGGDMHKLVEMCLVGGFNWVSIKVTSGILVYRGTWYEGYQQQKLLDIVVPLLKAAGIEVHFWGYTFGQRPGKESNPILEMIAKHRPLSYTINAENEYKEPGMGAAATTHASTIRWGMSISDSDDIPDIPILLSSYRWPSVHPEFPWEEFAKYIDAWNPQVYWEGAHNPASQLSRSVAELRKIKDVPIIPAGAAYPAGRWKPVIGDFQEFNDTAQELGLLGVHYWEWYYAEVKYPQWWVAISAHEWGAEPPPPPPPPPEPDLQAFRNTVLDEVIDHIGKLKT